MCFKLQLPIFLLTALMFGFWLSYTPARVAGSARDTGTQAGDEIYSPRPGTRCSGKKRTGPRCVWRVGEINNPPVINLLASDDTITIPCKEGTTSQNCTASDTRKIELLASALDKDADRLFFTYTDTGGSISGSPGQLIWDLSGAEPRGYTTTVDAVMWDLSTAQPGTYTVTAEVDDGCGCVAIASTTITVKNCLGCASK